MAKPPRKNAQGQWEIDLPRDRFRPGLDGMRIEVRTSDMREGGALCGLDSTDGDVEMIMLNAPGINPATARVSLLVPTNPDERDLELKREWEEHTSPLGKLRLGSQGRGILDQMTAIPDPRTVAVHPRTLRRSIGRSTDLRPFLSDDLMFAKKPHVAMVKHRAAKAITEAHRTSRAFVFDDAAAYRVGEICAYLPELIADQQEFARCPYPRTWIEMSAEPFARAMHDAGLEYLTFEDSGDERLGFLYTERGIYTAAANHSMEAAWSPIAYRPHQPMTHDQEQRFCHDFDVSRVQIDQFMWGNGYDGLDPSRRRSLRAQHGIDILLEDDVLANQPGGLKPMLRGGGAGDLKLALCAALLLIRPNLTVVTEERAPARKLILGRPTVFLAHRVVTVRLDADRMVRRIKRACKEEAGRARARWHEVRGHYMHNHRAKVSSCVHDWREVEPLRWECAGCGGRRAWRTYPEGRGSAEIGVVTKHYEVRP